LGEKLRLIEGSVNPNGCGARWETKRVFRSVFEKLGGGGAGGKERKRSGMKRNAQKPGPRHWGEGDWVTKVGRN